MKIKIKEDPTLAEVLASYRDTIDFEFRGGPDDANARGIEDTVLHIAVSQGNAHHVRVLLANGARPNEIGEMGATPLHNAVMYGNAQICELLIAAGARHDIKDEFDRTPKEFAKSKGHKDILQLMVGG